MPVTQPMLVLACCTFAVSQIVLALLLLWSERPLQQQQWFFAAFLVALAGYLLDPVSSGVVLDVALPALTLFVPGTFFLFSASLFDDHFDLQPWHFALVGVTSVPPLLALLTGAAPGTATDTLLRAVPQVLEFPLLAYALFVAVRFWSPDLVEERRQLRLWFSGFSGTYILLLILLREVVLPDSEVFASLQFVPPAVVLLMTNLILLRYRAGLWKPAEVPGAIDTPAEAPPAEAPAPAPEPRADPGLLVQLRTLMDDELAYREMGLTLPELARQMEVPAYRLRETINRGLGYRNFNDFLNSYRIREAAARLGDPQQQDTQILVIALDAGFRSLSSFNKAFRAEFQATPTEYRQARLDAIS
jgi:AraC-like DNA-binding protein